MGWPSSPRYSRRCCGSCSTRAENTAPFSAYFAAIMFTAWYGGLGPSLVALVSGAVLADYFFVEPRGSLLSTIWNTKSASACTSSWASSWRC